MAFLELTSVSKGYGSGMNRSEVLHDISLTVEKGEFVALLGYSGVGKTTLMSMIAGLIEPDQGEIRMEGNPIHGPSPDRGLVFQNYSLLPWMSVFDNVRLAVEQVYPNESRQQQRDRVLEALAMVNLSPAARKRPKELSGGMRQRTAVARTLVMRPRLLLLDEPLSALDALTRSVIQDQILEIFTAQKQTIVMITNDVDEALYLADRIIPLSLGPGATLGPEVKVDLERPRDRTAMNHDERYKRMRHDVIQFLLDQRQAARTERTQKPRSIPRAKPIDLSKTSNPSQPAAAAA